MAIDTEIFNNVTNIQELATASAQSDSGAGIFFSGIIVLIFLFILAGGSAKFDTREAFVGASIISLVISIFFWLLLLVPILIPTVFLILFILSIFFLLIGG